MTYVCAASRSYNAARSACRKQAVRLIDFGERRTLSSLQQHHRCFTSGGDDSSFKNQQEQHGMADSWSGINYCGINDGTGISSSDDSSTDLGGSSESLQIRFFETLLISDEDDGG